MKQYYEYLSQFYGDKGLLGLFYLASTKLPNLNNFFNAPILYIYGEKATGKTEFVNFIFKEWYTRMTFKQTSLPTFRNLLKSNAHLIHIDDVDTELGIEWTETFKSVYDPIQSGKRLIISGQVNLTKEVALFSRTIFIDLSRVFPFTEEQEWMFKAMSFIRDKAYFWTYKYKEDEARAIRCLLKADRIIENICANAEHRFKESYKSLLTAYFYFEDLFPVNEGKAVEIVVSNLERQQMMLSGAKKKYGQEAE